ncbi:MAG TPA: 3-methyl-2-oxobutanoate hydroxymethyltransferase [Bryobacteraceae bacterium]|jgi:3-methyl-2-oxobutanoate hydroxymethyltransferase
MSVRIPDIQAKKTRGEKITMLTAYATWMARLLDASGMVDMLLVGDSLGMVDLGYGTTIPVTMNDMVRHTRAVRAGAPDALIVADMPFLSHQISVAQAIRNAGRLMQHGAATAVKMEGGESAVEAVGRIASAGIPVMGHLGLQPQSVHAQGGFRKQATQPEEQNRLMADAVALENAGVFAIVLECVPRTLACAVTRRLRVPVIGIGSGPDCDGQVLVTHDILGLSGDAAPSFAKQYADVGQAIGNAVKAFSEDVRAGRYPDA